jgi:hypothetical protein
VAGSTAFVTARVIARRAIREKTSVNLEDLINQAVQEAKRQPVDLAHGAGGGPGSIFVVGSNITIITQALPAPAGVLRTDPLPAAKASVAPKMTPAA